MEINEKINEIIQQACCGIQASEVVLIVSIRTAESYVGKITVGQNTGAQNWRNSYGMGSS